MSRHVRTPFRVLYGVCGAVRNRRGSSVIGAGVPGSAVEWPDGVLAALRAFRQGDLVAGPPMAYLADPKAPVWAESVRFAEEAATSGDPPEPDIIRFPEGLTPPYGMITTQTCDLVEEDADPPGWPWAQLVPVYDMDEAFNSGEKNLLRQGRFRRSLLHVPALKPGFYVADFRISFPVEKGWLARQGRIDGFGTEELRQRVGDRLALLSGRPAFARSFVATIQNPLTEALRTLKRVDRAAFDRMDEVVPEVGVLMDSRLSPSNVQVVVVSTTPLDAGQTEWWSAWWDGCRQRAAAMGITLQALDFKVLDKNYSAAEYRRLTHLSLPNVSPD